MILIRLQLSSFRGYERLDLGFGPGITAVVGENAAGKTNLVEAIQFLSLARSFRTNDDAVLIQDGKNVAVIDATLSEGALTRNIRIELSKDAKKVYVTGSPSDVSANCRGSSTSSNSPPPTYPCFADRQVSGGPSLISASPNSL